MPLAVSSDEPPPRPTSESTPRLASHHGRPPRSSRCPGSRRTRSRPAGRCRPARSPESGSLRVARGHDAGVGHQQGAPEAELARQLSEARERPVAEDDAGPKLHVEGRHTSLDSTRRGRRVAGADRGACGRLDRRACGGPWLPGDRRPSRGPGPRRAARGRPHLRVHRGEGVSRGRLVRGRRVLRPRRAGLGRRRVGRFRGSRRGDRATWRRPRRTSSRPSSPTS